VLQLNRAVVRISAVEVAGMCVGVVVGNDAVPGDVKEVAAIDGDGYAAAPATCSIAAARPNREFEHVSVPDVRFKGISASIAH